MNKWLYNAADFAGIFATCIFILLLVWYLIRYFAGAESKQPRLFSKSTNKLPTPATPLPKVIMWVLIAFVVSRGLMYLGGLWAAQRAGSLASYLANPEAYWTRWDGHHYIGLIENWYVNEGDPRLHIVFFPLYPAIGRLIHLATGLSATACAYLVSNLAFLGCGIVMFYLAEVTYGKKAGLRAMWFMNLSPLTLFCSTTYTESVFMLTTLAAVYLARRRKFFWAVAMGALSANSRMVGMATAIPIFYEMLRASDGPRLRRYAGCVLRVLPVSLGLIAYLALNWQVTGDPFRFLVYQSEHWSQNFGSLYNTLSYTMVNAFEFYDTGYRIGVWIPQLLAILIALILFIAVIWRSHPGDMGYSLVYYYCSIAPTWLLSGPRYLTAMYTAYPLMAMLFRRRWAFVSICILFAALCVLGGAMFSVRGCIL